MPISSRESNAFTSVAARGESFGESNGHRTAAGGLAQLVLALADVIRRLMERQVLRRMQVDSLTDVQVERLGSSLSKLEDQIRELKQTLHGTSQRTGHDEPDSLS